MKKINKLIISITILLTSFSTVIAKESITLSNGNTIDFEKFEPFKYSLGFNSVAEIRNFLEAIREFHYHNSVMTEFFTSEYCNNPEVRSQTQITLSEYRIFNNHLFALKAKLAGNKNLKDLSLAIMDRILEGSRIGDEESESFTTKREFDFSITYANHSFSRLKERFNTILETYETSFIKSEL